MSNFMFQFIHSLEMREKAYFKRYAEIHDSNKSKNYLLLYDFIEQMPVFDFESLKSHFADRSIGKYLSSELNYLQDQLLRSLVNFHFNSSPAYKLHKDILYINILMEKGFSKKAIKLLRKAKKTAYTYEDFSVILGLIQQEEEILFFEGILGFTDKLMELQKEREKISAQITNLNTLRILREQIRELQFTVGSVSDTSEFPQIFDHPLLKSEEEALSIRAKEHWYYITDFCFYLTREYQRSIDISKSYLAFVEQNLNIFKDSKLLPLISNYLHNCILGEDNDTFSTVLKKLDALIDDPKLDKVYINYIRYSRMMDMDFKMNASADIDQMMPELIEYTNDNIDKLSEVQSEYFLRLLVRGCILNDKFQDALKWISLIYGSRAVDYTLGINRIYSFIIYFEMGWIEKLSSELETASKVLKKRGKLTYLPKVFIRFFKAYIKKPENLKKLFLKLEKELKILSMDKEQNYPFDQFDYIKWCQTYQAKHSID